MAWPVSHLPPIHPSIHQATDHRPPATDHHLIHAPLNPFCLFFFWPSFLGPVDSRPHRARNCHSNYTRLVLFCSPISPPQSTVVSSSSPLDLLSSNLLLISIFFLAVSLLQLETSLFPALAAYCLEGSGHSAAHTTNRLALPTTNRHLNFFVLGHHTFFFPLFSPAPLLDSPVSQADPVSFEPDTAIIMRSTSPPARN